MDDPAGRRSFSNIRSTLRLFPKTLEVCGGPNKSEEPRTSRASAASAPANAGSDRIRATNAIRDKCDFSFSREANLVLLLSCLVS